MPVPCTASGVGFWELSGQADTSKLCTVPWPQVRTAIILRGEAKLGKLGQPQRWLCLPRIHAQACFMGPDDLAVDRPQNMDQPDPQGHGSLAWLRAQQLSQSHSQPGAAHPCTRSRTYHQALSPTTPVNHAGSHLGVRGRAQEPWRSASPEAFAEPQHGQARTHKLCNSQEHAMTPPQCLAVATPLGKDHTAHLAGLGRAQEPWRFGSRGVFAEPQPECPPGRGAPAPWGAGPLRKLPPACA